MINGIKLIALHEAQQVREFHGNDAVGLKEDLHAANQVVNIRHVRQYIVSDEQVGLAVFLLQGLSGFNTEEAYLCADALLDGILGHVRRGLDAQHGNTLVYKILEEVTIVAGHFRNQAIGTDGETLDHLVGVVGNVLEPRVRIGGKVRVVVKDLTGRHEFFELNQEAVVANVCMQWIEGFHPLQLFGLDVILAQGRHAQIDKRVLQRSFTKAADALVVVRGHSHSVSLKKGFDSTLMACKRRKF